MTMSSTSISVDQDYSYGVAVSSTVTPRLKNKDGTDYSRGDIAIVLLYIRGTGTPDTDQVYMVGYNGSNNVEIRDIKTNSPNVSNRPQLYLDSAGQPVIRTGHGSTYTVRVRVIKSIG